MFQLESLVTESEELIINEPRNFDHSGETDSQLDTLLQEGKGCMVVCVETWGILGLLMVGEWSLPKDRKVSRVDARAG